jgi:hypothetical protein
VLETIESGDPADRARGILAVQLQQMTRLLDARLDLARLSARTRTPPT